MESMMPPSGKDQDQPASLLRRCRQGDEAAWGELLLQHQERLMRMIQLRIDPRLRGRIDPADVVQESFLQASKRREEYFDQSDLPFFVWLRLLTVQKLAELHRHHLGVKARDAGRDVSLFSPAAPATSAVLAAQLLGQTTTPSQDVAREEIEQRVRDVLESMDEIDREVIALRNFEQLSNLEAASVLGIGASAASSRYIRALKKLKDVLSDMPAFDEFAARQEP
jgi:RNA polymerase sigma-70 factor (ECF subfamily)